MRIALYEQEITKKQTELELLQEQVRPHFFLNCLSLVHSLADRDSNWEITELLEDLSGYIEICHGDPFVPSLPMSDIKKAEMDENVTKRVYVYSRGSQLDLLATVPHTYMWVSPTDVEQLERYELVLKPCRGNKHRVYRDILTSKKEYKYTAVDKQFIEKLYEERDLLSAKFGTPHAE